MAPSTPTDSLEDRLLRPPHLDGTAFTRAVISSLPPPRRSLRPWILGVGGLAGAAITAALLARSAESMGSAIVTALSGSVPSGPGLGAIWVLSVAGLVSALVATGELRAQDTR